MRIPGIKTAKTLSRWLQARLLGGALILGYHRISAAEDDFYQVCVSPENFARHMETLRENAHPISLSKLVQSFKQNGLPQKSVAITFDDGYAETLHVAKPILDKYDIPATVFICTGYLGREFWWDELERLVMSSQTDLGTLHLDNGVSQFAWKPRKVGLEVDSNLRSRFCDAVYNFLLALDVEDQNRAMDAIRRWSGLSFDESHGSRTMNVEELLQLADGGLIEIGAHTKHHPMLPHLTFERQREEIITCKLDLESLLNKEIAGFAYPNGRATAEAKQIVRDAGFLYACASLHDVVRTASDQYELTRFWQKDVDGEQFMRNLKSWM